MKQDAEILSLTGLRFVAALYVFLFHMQIRWPITTRPFFKEVLEQGAIGMSVFFVLSGFLLTYRYVDGSGTVKNYMLNRFARIYPIYVLSALSTLPWIGIEMADNDYWVSLGKIIFLVISNVFLVQAWFPQLFGFWNDGGSWSISVEAFCYVILPFVLPAMALLSNSKLLIVVGVCWLLAVMPGVSSFLFGSPPFAVYYAVPIFRLPEFLLGVCALLAVRNGLKVRFSGLLTILIPIVVAFYLWGYGAVMPPYIGNNWIVLPAILYMVVALSAGRGFVSSLLSSKLAVWLGKISYCFYSLQALVLFVIISNYQKLTELWPLLLSGKILALVALMVLILISAAAYYLIEEPCRHWLRSKQKKSPEQDAVPALTAESQR